MDDQRWEALARRLEQRARKDPTGYRRKVAGVAALGYGYIALALLVLAALGAGVIYLGIHHPGPLLKLLLPILAVGWVVVRSLAVRIDPPEGIELHRRDAPALFETEMRFRSRSICRSRSVRFSSRSVTARRQPLTGRAASRRTARAGRRAALGA